MTKGETGDFGASYMDFEMAQQFSQLSSPSKEDSRSLEDRLGSSVVRSSDMDRNRARRRTINEQLALTVAEDCDYNEFQRGGTFASSDAFLPDQQVDPVPVPVLVPGEGTGENARTVEQKIVLYYKGTVLRSSEIKAMKKIQRGQHGMWSPEWAFPGQGTGSKDVMHRDALAVVPSWICHGLNGCLRGDCCAQLHSSDVLAMRQHFQNRIALTRLTHGGKGASLADLVRDDLARLYNRTNEQWGYISWALTDYASAMLCATSYGIAAGLPSSTYYKNVYLPILQSSDDDFAAVRFQERVPRTIAQLDERRSLDYSMLAAYVRSLLYSHESQPAPGATKAQGVTILSRRSWTAKWSNANKHFKEAQHGYMPGSQSMLKRVWKRETRLKEHKLKTHSKCNICASGHSTLARITGDNSEPTVLLRQNIMQTLAQHEEIHLGMRRVLDDAGHNAIVTNRQQWTIIVDAATQKNFELPKFKGRRPKMFGKVPVWGFKLMCIYCYGYGFVPYLVHDSQKGGPNLLWTVIWETVCDMRQHYGYYAEQLHIQLDNTKSENKTYVLISMAAWLVKTGRFKRVRVFFLLVGHTHVIIDQIFGALTTGTKGKELFLPEHLIENIEVTCGQNPNWMAKPVRWLKTLFDYTSWCDSMDCSSLLRLFDGNLSDEDGTYSGMYDYVLFEQGQHVLLQYRESHTHSYWPKDAPGAETIRALPVAPPILQDPKGKKEWAVQNNAKLEDTIVMAVGFSEDITTKAGRNLVVQQFVQHIEDIKPLASLLPKDHQLVFRHFQSPAFRLGYNPNADENGEQNAHERVKALALKQWQARFFSMRTDPLPFDPVISSAQSEVQFRKALEAYKLVFTGSEPTLDKLNSCIFEGSMHLISRAGHTGVTLARIAQAARTTGPRSQDGIWYAVLYDHTPNQDGVSGMFGTFTKSLINDPERPNVKKENRARITREDIKVYNVVLHPTRLVLSLPSLRSLARAEPEHYPFPPDEDIPTSHLENENSESARRQTKRGAARTVAGRTTAASQPRMKPLFVKNPGSSKRRNMSVHSAVRTHGSSP